MTKTQTLFITNRTKEQLPIVTIYCVMPDDGDTLAADINHQPRNINNIG